MISYIKNLLHNLLSWFIVRLKGKELMSEWEDKPVKDKSTTAKEVVLNNTSLSVCKTNDKYFFVEVLFNLETKQASVVKCTPCVNKEDAEEMFKIKAVELEFV